MNKKIIILSISVTLSLGLGVATPFIVVGVTNLNRNTIVSPTLKIETIEKSYNSIDEIKENYDNIDKYAVVLLKDGLSGYETKDNVIGVSIEKEGKSERLSAILQKATYQSKTDSLNVELKMTSRWISEGHIDNSNPEYVIDENKNEITYYLYTYSGGYAYSLDFKFPEINKEETYSTLKEESKNISNTFLKLAIEKCNNVKFNG